MKYYYLNSKVKAFEQFCLISINLIVKSSFIYKNCSDCNELL